MRSLTNKTPSRSELRALLTASQEPESARHATKLAMKRLDANYKKKADLEKIVQGTSQLNQTEITV